MIFSETQQHDLLFLEENRNLLIFINKAKILPNNLLVIVALASFKLTELKHNFPCRDCPPVVFLCITHQGMTSFLHLYQELQFF